MRLNNVKNYNVARFSLECECLDDDQETKRQNFELGCENGGKRAWREEATMDGNGPVVETLAQDGLQMDREKCNMNVVSAIRERAIKAGRVARMDYKEICAKALRCRGLQWWRWRQLHWKEVEKDKWSGPAPHSVSKSTGGKTWSNSRFRKRTRFVGISPEFRKLGRAPSGRSHVPRGPKCVGHGVD